jgi:hypothetical protein
LCKRGLKTVTENRYLTAGGSEWGNGYPPGVGMEVKREGGGGEGPVLARSFFLAPSSAMPATGAMRETAGFSPYVRLVTAGNG